jgi:hypothetical protein
MFDANTRLHEQLRGVYLPFLNTCTALLACALYEQILCSCGMRVRNTAVGIS